MVKLAHPAPALRDARRTYGGLPTVHLGSVLRDGRPHVVPLWFVWLEDAIYVSCRRESQVMANVRRDPRVALQFDRGRVWTELGGVLVQGRAEPILPEEPASRRPMSAWFEKYRADLAGDGFLAYTEEVPHPILLRVDPERLSAWVHRPLPAR